MSLRLIFFPDSRVGLGYARRRNSTSTSGNPCELGATYQIRASYTEIGIGPTIK
jgi:hypothetical protein